MIRLKKIFAFIIYLCSIGSWFYNFLVKFVLLRLKFKGYDISVLKANGEYKNKFLGKRVFIIGNGPSLKNLDFSVLANEYVATCNCIMIHPKFKELKSNFYFHVDLNGFGLLQNVGGSDGKKSINMMKSLEDTYVECLFVPLIAKDVVEKNAINRHLKVRYIQPYGRGWLFKGVKDIDLTSVTPGYANVVPFMIETMLYMGFSEIYLLGCDFTIIKGVIDIALNKPLGNIHVYDEPDNGQEEGLKNVLRYRGLKDVIKETYEIMDDYKFLYEYSKLKRVKLYNLSEQTLIDSIPRMNLKDLKFDVK